MYTCTHTYIYIYIYVNLIIIYISLYNIYKYILQCAPNDFFISYFCPDTFLARTILDIRVNHSRISVGFQSRLGPPPTIRKMTPNIGFCGVFEESAVIHHPTEPLFISFYVL